MSPPTSWAANTSHKFLRLPNESIFLYNAHDAHNTAKLFLAMRAEMQSQNFPTQWNFYTEWVQPLQAAVMDMQKRGILLDKEKKHTYHMNLRRELNETDQFIRDYADQTGFTDYTDKFPNSGMQTGKFLFDHLKLKSHKKTETGRYSVDQDALTRVLKKFRKKDEPHRQLLYSLFHRARLQTILTRYMTIPLGPDKRCRPTVKITGTKTFRYAYADPALQQFPPEVRHLFQAERGKILIASDYSQLEARILAYLSGDEISIEAFNSGKDVHTQNARDLFGLSKTQWEGLGGKAKAYRNFAKGFLYRISYGGEGAVEKSKTYCPCEKCADRTPQSLTLKKYEILNAEENWFKTHHWVRKFQDSLCESVQRNHYYESPFGLRRWISKPWGNDLRREVLNIPMQMNGAIRMNQAQVKMHAMGLPIILQFHDAFLLEVPETPGSLVDQHIADMKGVMEEPVEAFGGVSFPVDTEIGHNWGAYSQDNPNGLKEVK